MRENIIPDYFQGFCDYFEGLLQSAFTIANQAARHGKRNIPELKNSPNQAIASFMLNLTGTLLLFIMERFEETHPKKSEHIDDDIWEDDDIPF
jgi:hypothetical protein